MWGDGLHKPFIGGELAPWARGPELRTYPRWRAFTWRLMPTMERRTLPQLGHRHLYITFMEF
jgi:hypothetical protein